MRHDVICQLTVLYRQGQSDKQIGEALGYSHNTIRKARLRLGLKRMPGPRLEGGPSITLCWTCQKACGRCSWTAWDFATERPKFEPVEGWEAKPRTLYANDKEHGPMLTYEVHRCHQYIPDKPRGKELACGG